MSSGSESASGVTRRLAPRLRNSWARRSPTSRDTLSAAVATAIPRASAARVSNLRFGRRGNESAPSRRNIYRGLVSAPNLLTRNLFRSFGHRRNIDDHIVALNLRRKFDWIATALAPDRGNINRRGAVTADYVLPVLAVAFGSADEAGIECRTIAIGLLDDHEADSLPVGIQREEMQIPILHFGDRNLYDAIHRFQGPGLRRRRIHLGVDEIGCKRQDHRQAYTGRGDHPATLAAILRLNQAAVRVIRHSSGGLVVRGRLPLAEDHQGGRAEHKHEEEKFVSDNRSQDGHLCFAGRQPTGFA